MLSGQNATDIEKIEIIRNPNASYDVRPDGAIVNIIMKKNNLKGLQGNTRLNSYKNSFNNLSGNMYLNYNLYNLNIGGSIYGGNTRSAYFSQEKNQFLSTHIHQEQEVHTPHKTNYYGGSSIHISYEINAKHSLQWSTQLYYNTTSIKEHNTNQFYNQHKIDSSFSVHNNNYNHVVENSNNLNYTYATNKKGAKLEVFLDYTYYHNTISNTTNIYKGIQAIPTVFTQSILQKVPRYIYSYYLAGFNFNRK